MTVYEQELRKLFEHSNLVDRPQFSGRVCVGDLGKDLRVRAEFLSTHISSQYDAIRLTVLNRTEGVVDRTLLRFQDVWGKKQVPNNPNFRSGVIPHLWDDYGKVEWYAYGKIQFIAIRSFYGNGITNRNTHYLLCIFSHQRFITCLWKNTFFNLVSPDFSYIAFITTAYRYIFSTQSVA